jgi:hypothetical protein
MVSALGVMLLTGALLHSEPAPAPPNATGAKGATTRPDRFHADVTPLLQRYCYECHGDGADSGKLTLDSYKSTSDLLADKTRWEKILRYVRTQTMPPPEAEQHPSQPVRDRLVKAIQRELYQIDPDKPDPGRVTIRRLNRVEYRNTIRDLTAVTFDPTIDFPQDDSGYGFDNIADVLTLPPMLMEKYLAAAEKILDEAIPTGAVESRERHIAASEARASFDRSDRIRDGFARLTSADEDALSVTGQSPAPGEYIVRVLAYASYPAPPPSGQTDNPPVKLSLMRGDVVVREVEVTADESKPQWYEARMGVPAGQYTIRAAVRRQRGLEADKELTAGRIGREQPGSIFIKEMVIDGPVMGALQLFPPDRIDTAGAASHEEDGDVALNKTGDEAAAAIEVATEGRYLIRAQAYAQYAGKEYAQMEMLLDDKSIASFEVTAPAAWRVPEGVKVKERARRAVPQVYEVESKLAAGKHRVTLRYLNNLLDPESPDPNYRDRNIYVQNMQLVELSAPPGSRPMTAPMRKLFARHGKPSDPPDPRGVLEDFALRAWRRPPQGEEIDRLMALYDLARQNGESFQGSVRHAMKAILVSPSFLFRGETETPHNAVAEAHPIDEFELASRLSYFLWSTTPDNELMDLARRGELRKNLEPQVKRMLASPRSRELVENFAGQWLQFRNLDAAHPDRRKFDNYDDRLRDAMQKETQLFFESIVRDDRSVLDVLTGDYTFVNERLAKHYGLADVKGEEFRRVSLQGTPRRGVLTQGSVLTLTSNPTRTSPVKRGKWVLENLLGVEPLPPPQNVPPLDKSHGEEKGLTLRQRMEKHRADPTCASCHAPMDPIGFALENFDAVGAFREKDGSDRIDPSAVLPDGSKFSGAAELTALLVKTRRDDFLRAATEATMTFALGRGVEPYDQPAVDKIVDDLNRNNGRFSTLVMGVVNSVPFQMRRAEADQPQQQARVGGMP